MVVAALKVVVSVTVLEPKVIVLVFELLLEILLAVTLKFAVLNVPWVTVIALVPVFMASPSVTVIPDPFTVRPLKVLPAVVRVAVASIVTVPVWV